MAQAATDFPLVSVVTPSWNQGKFIEETIRSVLDQDYPNIEYLVIDGGSTDETLDVIKQYADRIAFWVSEPDGGQAAAINKGWSRSTGQILAFLNSDDCYKPGAIRKAVDAFRAHPDAALVYGQAQWVAADGSPLRTTNIHVDGQDLLDRPYQGIPQPAVFLKRTVIERVGALDPSFQFALDGEFFVRAIGNYRAVTLPDVLATMRLHPESKSVSAALGFIPEVFRWAEKVIANPSAYPRYSVRPEDVRAGANISAARYQNIGGAHITALKHLWRSARLSPKYRQQILLRELPRVTAHLLLGSSWYERIANRVAALRS
jgi:glycosyltransferase involved in cell wall biosynthesis